MFSGNRGRCSGYERGDAKAVDATDSHISHLWTSLRHVLASPSRAGRCPGKKARQRGIPRTRSNASRGFLYAYILPRPPHLERKTAMINGCRDALAGETEYLHSGQRGINLYYIPVIINIRLLGASVFRCDSPPRDCTPPLRRRLSNNPYTREPNGFR